MRRVVLVLGVGALLAGCGDAALRATAPRLDAVFVSQQNDAEIAAAQAGANAHNLFLTQLAGENEVPPHATPAHGNVVVRLTENATGDAIDYVLVANQITNVIASHIHIAPAGVNGPIVVFLFGNVPAGGGPHDGLLAQGTFTAADLIGPMAGHSIADLVAEIRAGHAYVNVHTNDGIAPTNTGPGDFPGGEIRGQLNVNGVHP